MEAVIQTSENATKEIFQTHYYKTSYNQLKDAYLTLLEQLNYQVVSIDDNYSEIFAEIPSMTVTATIIEQKPTETSIDFAISAEFFLGSKKKPKIF